MNPLTRAIKGNIEAACEKIRGDANDILLEATEDQEHACASIEEALTTITRNLESLS